MKYFLIISFILFSFNKLSYAQENENNSLFQECSDQYSVLTFNEKTNEIIYAKRADKIIYPASLVKLMTLYLTFEAIEANLIDPEDEMIASKRAQEVSDVNSVNTLHLTIGDKLNVRQAIRALIVKSFNEAAVMLGEKISTSEWEFVRKMNVKATELGMLNTSFKNSSGLHDEGQYTTAYDLARLTKALKNDFPKYYHLFSLKEFIHNEKIYPTHNHVLVDYKGAEGMKTGFTRASGFNLITSAKKGDTRLITILAACASYEKRDKFMMQLLDYSFNLVKEKLFFKNIKLHDGFQYQRQHLQNYEKNIESKMRFDMII